MLKKLIGLGIVLIAISGCSDSKPFNEFSGSGVPVESITGGGTPTANPSTTASFKALGAAIDASIYQAYQTGLVERFSETGTAVYTEVYDPNSKYDYKGAGWTATTDQVELVLELDMFALWQMQTAYQAADISDFVVNIDGTFGLTINQPNMPRYAQFSLSADGFIRQIVYPKANPARTIDLTYTIDSEAAAIIRRANEESNL